MCIELVAREFSGAAGISPSLLAHEPVRFEMNHVGNPRQAGLHEGCDCDPQQRVLKSQRIEMRDSRSAIRIRSLERGDLGMAKSCAIREALAPIRATRGRDRYRTRSAAPGPPCARLAIRYSAEPSRAGRSGLPRPREVSALRPRWHFTLDPDGETRPRRLKVVAPPIPR